MATTTDNYSTMQTILGAGGSIGFELAKELPKYTNHIRLVGRTPKKVNADDELFPAKLSDPKQVDRAVSGSAVVYVTIGFEYSAKSWQQLWPPFIKSVITSCKKHNARLVFFDNIYMYDPDFLGRMTEETPMRSVSKKGAVRQEIATLLLHEMAHSDLDVLIARSADFIGPKNSVLVEMVYKNLLKGKKADWFISADKLHNFTFTPDAAKATAILGNTPDAYNQVWHLPTDTTPLTGKDWVQLFANQMDMAPQVRVLPQWLLGMLGIFIPVLKEFREMSYQYDRDYVFESSKFEERFNFRPTTPEAAVKAIVDGLSV